ncbi:unnamed protein product [Thlaspi arvense]|uniref:Mitogen-activated protein kinase n=1 Tax=Thlaspi arvense TaxID=13288 RepID=A0AAU9SRF5_THLAR|nr:unnamed protein product [Thlaspi arvense]
MSLTQDPPRVFFRCGNPFKILFPKNNNARLSPKLLSIVNNFETKMTVSIRELIPKDENDIVTVSWMSQAMESLCGTHKALRTLVTDLELPVSDLEEDLIHMYADISLKLLDLCNAFTSELDRLNHGNLLLKFAFSKLETNNCPEESSLSHLDSWYQHMASKNPRVENCGAVLSSLVESLNHHHLPKKGKKKHSAKGEVLLRALYGTKVKTLYIFSVFAAAFSGSSKNLLYLTIPKEMEKLPWAQAFMELQYSINPEIKNTFLSDGFTVIRDLEAVESGVKKLKTAVQEGSVPNVLVEVMKSSVIEISERFDLVSKETRCLLKIVISARDALLGSLWTKYAEELGGVTLPMIKSGTIPIQQLEMPIKEKTKVELTWIEKNEEEDENPFRFTGRPRGAFPLNHMSAESCFGGSGDQNTKGYPTHGGSYVQYNVYGNLFEVSRKYVPPLRPIGRGAYGIVCAATNSETGEEVAIKKIGNAFDNIIDAKRTLREIKLLKHMDHENVIAVKDIIKPPKQENFNDVYIVYELMDTDLHQIIRSNQPLTDDHCRFFLYQLLRGLKYVHSANVLHRDLKPSNLLLNANCDLKLGDFGLARTKSETDFMTEYVVTRWYRAPELLLNCSEYTAAIDIWSVGCILGETMTREPLFPGKDYVHQLRLITELIGSPDDSSLGFLRSDNARRYVRQLPQYPRQNFAARFPNMSAGAVDLLEKMLVFDPSRRITVDEALCHPYLAPLHDINEEPVCVRPFNFDFEQPSLTEENIKELIYRETVKFNPQE